ncbi:MAG: GNAT family N-acetyltransferase [Lachnospiraceae bacterium]|nr:GNAT family N-acetyltransferase [Lachnospiraceae bacterium]
MIELRENVLCVEDYLAIRAKVGWKVLSQSQAEKALDNSLFVLSAYDDGELVGMGRIVGDGAVICYVQDLIVVPRVQGNHIGSMILEHLKAYVSSLRMEHTEMMFCLMCAKGREQFYEKHGFFARPTPNLGPGMMQYISDDK